MQVIVVTSSGKEIAARIPADRLTDVMDETYEWSSVLSLRPGSIGWSGSPLTGHGTQLTFVSPSAYKRDPRVVIPQSNVDYIVLPQADEHD